jgi:predicted small lipoprotein YifL
MKKIFSIFTVNIIVFQTLVSCGLYRPVDATKYPPQPELRVKKNMEEGRGIKLFKSGENNGGKFEFANANPLWRASLNTLDFMPLLSVDYGGGVIITDWYSEENSNDAIKISIQFLSNEVRSDALDIKVFKKKCTNLSDCKIIQSQSDINQELKVSILKKAAQYEANDVEKNRKNYPVKENK